MPKERRRSPRHQLGRVAAIFSSGRRTSCLVKDFSDGGVRLQLNGFEIPDDFALLFAPNKLRKVAVTKSFGVWEMMSGPIHRPSVTSLVLKGNAILPSNDLVRVDRATLLAVQALRSF